MIYSFEMVAIMFECDVRSAYNKSVHAPVEVTDYCTRPDLLQVRQCIRLGWVVPGSPFSHVTFVQLLQRGRYQT